MVRSTALALSAASLLFSLSAHAGLYPKSSKVLSVDGRSYERLITKSNHTSIVEFYAPWCGHCKNLQPAYEKAAVSLQGLANVAAVDCDEESNKAFCGTMGVQGFPTLKIVRPGKKVGKPVVEDYQGARAAKAIVDAVVDKIPNHVKKVSDKDVEGWLKQGNDSAKAVLFTDKGTTSALLRALAIDYLDSIPFAQIRNKEKSAVATFSVTKYPTFLVLPGGDKDAVIYDGELKKEAMSSFVKEVSGTSPNPGLATVEPKTKKADKKAEKKKDNKKAPSSQKAEAAHTSVKDQSPPTESLDTQLGGVPPPVEIEQGAPMILMLEKEEDLQRECLTTTSHICILCLLPTKNHKDDPLPREGTQALISLAEVQQKHSKRHSLFPFYSVPVHNSLNQKIRDTMKLKPANEIEVIAVNAKRLWSRRFTGAGFMPKDVEEFVDMVRMNEGKRDKLPESLVTEGSSEAAEPAEADTPPQAEQEPPLYPIKGKPVVNQNGLEVELMDDSEGTESVKAKEPIEHNEL